MSKHAENTEWQMMDIERHINCGEVGTPHLEAVFHPEGHTVVDHVRVRFVDPSEEMKS